MNKVHKKEHILRIRMLGGFSMEYDQVQIFSERQNYPKFIQLFLLLVLYQETGIQKDILLENMYGQKEGKNSNNNLNNMLSRLRKQLQELGLPEDDIVIRNGLCWYNSSSQLKVDVQELEELIEKAEDPQTQAEERKACLMEAVELYQGEFLPGTFSGLSLKPWVIRERMRCKQLYETALAELGQIFIQDENFKECYNIYSHAAKLYPLEWFQEKQIECLTAMNQDQKAFQIYQDTVQIYRNQLGLPPSEENMRRLQEMEDKLFGYSKSLERIREDLQEEQREPGAYFCSYPSFIDCSCLFMRNGKKAFFLMCTLADGEEMTEEAREKKAGYLYQSIQECLRQEDIYTRYSKWQYLALLMGTDTGNAYQITCRIDQRYQELNKSRSPEIRYEITDPGHCRGESESPDGWNRQKGVLECGREARSIDGQGPPGHLYDTDPIS